MKEISLTLFTYQVFNKQNIAKSVFDSLSENGFLFTKMGVTEPLKVRYSREEAISLWCSETEGCYDIELEKMVGKAGNFMAKGPKSLFMGSQWWHCPNKKKLNYIYLTFSVDVLDSKKQEVLYLFKEFIVLFEALYGEITHSDALKRQHVTGTPDLRLPGVFWCNYYSNEYLALMNCREQVESFEWWKKEDMEERGHGRRNDDLPKRRPWRVGRA
ncbi:hypothetical protein [Paenibacillus chitinolyticus]|uniref:Uncharacterized protein n=1 Tax=Paenibacillus chitinolyticus TaxID=79263 RepID=A0ABT4FFZ2_9BACL|nr:hypothetical protein [Paenibacillus chitinolyticus]MCY9591346.1 hypothetical protein [Paenibacillus chitinolyticus]MCY9597407.1 hypothetical protein [Paenibacillus chitinolyticus]